MTAYKWIGIIIGSLSIALIVFIIFHIERADDLMHRSLDIEPVTMEVNIDSGALRIGRKWVNSICAECHGSDLGGNTVIEDPMIGRLYAPNLTSGVGGIGYLNNDNWLAALRHGISATGRPLLLMPSMEYTNMRKEDIGGIIAYLKTLPPVDRVNKESTFKPIAKFLLSAGVFGKLFGADVIDHNAPIPENRKHETLENRGEYLTEIIGCKGCHGESLSGKYTGDPISPLASNLTPSGNFSKWTFNDFYSFIHTGRTPEGKTVINRYMPWRAYSRLPDSELEAIYAYLKSLDAEHGNTRHISLHK